MKSWEMLKKTTPMYLCLSKNSTFIDKKNVYISKSGVQHYSCNFAIIENLDPIEQQAIIKQHFSCDGIIFSTEKNKENIDLWANSLNFKYLGKFPLMSREGRQFAINKKNYENKNVKIERVLNDITFKDFFLVFTKIRKLKSEESIKMFSKKIFDPNYFLYVAYYNNVPAGICVLIKANDGLMCVDVDVLKEFRELNILGMFSERGLSDGIQAKIYNYFALPTSQFVYKVGLEFGATVEGSCHLWQKGIKEVAQ